MASYSFCFATALAALVCFVTAFPGGGGKSNFKCDDECKQEMQKLKDMVTECMEQSGCSKEEFEKCKECNDDVPPKLQNFYACIAGKVGILDDKKMVSMDGLATLEQKMDDGCARVEASGDEDDTRKKVCDNKEGIKAAVRGCVEQGKNEQQENDNGVAATMAIRKCMCDFKKQGQGE